jgi:hypothetical protein
MVFAVSTIKTIGSTPDTTVATLDQGFPRAKPDVGE